MSCPIKFSNSSDCNYIKNYMLFFCFLFLGLIIWVFKLNQPLFYIINSWHGLLPDSVWETLNLISYSKFFILPALLIVITFIWQRAKLRQVIILIALYYIVFNILKITVGEARPYFVLPEGSFYWLHHYENVLQSAHKSFPSGHTGNMAIFVFTLSSFTNKKIIKIILFLLLVLVGFARICTGWHWPLDVIASGLIGYLLVQICICSSLFGSKKSQI